jgi:hypothetical protein
LATGLRSGMAVSIRASIHEPSRIKAANSFNCPQVRARSPVSRSIVRPSRAGSVPANRRPAPRSRQRFSRGNQPRRRRCAAINRKGLLRLPQGVLHVVPVSLMKSGSSSVESSGENSAKRAPRSIRKLAGDDGTSVKRMRHAAEVCRGMREEEAVISAAPLSINDGSTADDADSRRWNAR